MYTQCKYVVLRQSKNGMTRENIYIFPALVVHKTVTERMRGTPVGAGFVKTGKDGELHCVGASDSLSVSARKEDTILLRSLFI